VTALHLIADVVIVAGMVVAVGVVQLRRIPRSEEGKSGKRRNLSTYARRVSLNVLVLAAMYFFGYVVGFHHGGIRCDGVYISPQAQREYPQTYSVSGCYPLPDP